MIQINRDVDLVELQEMDIGYQYDSRDKEIFLESGYEYFVYHVSNDKLIKTIVNLED